MLPADYAMRNLSRRWGRTLLTGLSSAAVAALFVVTAAFVRGLERTFSGTAQADVAILLSQAAQGDILRSTTGAGLGALVEASVEGVVVASDEIHMGTSVVVPGAAGTRAGFVRGVRPSAYLVHDAVTLVEGRLPGPGEVLVGRLAARQLDVDDKALAIGATLELEGFEHRVVGRFAAPGTTIEGELWTPLEPLRAAAQRDDSSAVFVRLADAAALARLKLFCDRRLDLELDLVTSREYYAELVRYFEPIRHMAWALAVLIAFAALFGGVNTAAAAVQDRLRELAMLRAVGHGSGAIVLSLAQEALLLAAAGAVAGLALARVGLAGGSVRLAMSAFELRADAVAILVGFGAALAVGLCGVLPAALRVLRLPIAAALSDD